MSLKTPISFLLLFLLSQSVAFAQREYNIWHFGLGAGIDFNSGSPVVINNGKTNTREGVATFSDPTTGKLLFYTDGSTVWDASHTVMPNGGGLRGDGSSTQSGVIIPNPDVYTGGPNKDIYYLFTTSSNINGFQGVRYNIVDMSLPGNGSSLGDVTSKNNLLLTNNTERIGSVKHSNGNDFWIVTLERNTNKYYAYEVTKNGVNTTPVVSQAGFTMSLVTDIVGYLKFSTSGQKMATVFSGSGQIQVFNFDNTTGKVSPNNIITLNNLPSAYGVEFAADGEILYASQVSNSGRVWQYDLRSNNETTINNNRILLHSTSNQGLGAIQKAPDRKIYIASEIGFNNAGGFLDVINNPDAFGLAANYQAKALNFNGNRVLIGLPNFIASPCVTSLKAPDLGNDIFKCDETPTTLDAGSGYLSYSWSNGDNSQSITVDKSGTYKVQVIGECGNIYQDSVKLVLNSPPVLVFKDTTACQLQDIELQPVEVSSNASFLWNTGDTTSSIKVNNPGKYWATINTPCGSITDSVQVSITSSPQFTLSSVQNFNCQNQINQITPQISDLGIGATFLWNTGEKTPNINITEPGTYWLTITNTCGAMTDTIQVTLPEIPPIPNIITPNNDGKNEQFVLPNQLIGSMLVVYNRLGRQVYQSGSYNNDWKADGLPVGLYYYKIENQCYNDKIKGWIKVLK